MQEASSTKKVVWWRPCEDFEYKEAEEIHIDASYAFRHAFVVTTTKAQMCAICTRLRAETHADRVALSNERYRSVLLAQPETMHARAARGEQVEAWERLCGDVVVFHCVRWVLEGREIPLRA